MLPVRTIRIQKATPPEDSCTNHQVCYIVGGALGRIQKATPPEDSCTNHQVCYIVGGALGLE